MNGFYNALPLILIFLPFLTGIACYMFGRNNIKCAAYIADATVIIDFASALALLLTKSYIAISLPGICGFGLHFSLDGFRAVYITIAAFMWMMTTLFTREYMDGHDKYGRYYLFVLFTLGATMGVFMGADLITIFVFFEIMSFTSYVWVAQEETKESLKAADTYLAVAVIGGMCMLLGIFILVARLGWSGVNLDCLREEVNSLGSLDRTLAGTLITIGFAAKAGAFPLHIWLPKAHPVAPAPASALLSGILTKAGVLGIIIVRCRIFGDIDKAGVVFMLLGVLTMFGGALLGIFSINIKRILACSSMSQIGFIMIGVGAVGLAGENGVPAVYGSFLHMINHSLIKLVLFMVAGAIFMNSHELDINKVRGFGRKKPLLMIIFLTGALSIAGVPGFSGFVSKSLLHEAILLSNLGKLGTFVEWIFLISGGMTLCYMLKFFIAVFVEKNEDEILQAHYDEKKKYMNPISGFALTASAAVLLIWGIFPGRLMNAVAFLGADFYKLPVQFENMSYYNLENLKGAGISLTIGTALYLLVVRKLLLRERKYIDAWPQWWDTEEVIYKPILFKMFPWVFGVICRFFDSFIDNLVLLLRNTIYKDSPLPVHNKLSNLKAIRAKEDIDIVRRSVSYGFFLFGIGVIITVIYIFAL